jgi:hypothetical protein
MGGWGWGGGMTQGDTEYCPGEYYTSQSDAPCLLRVAGIPTLVGSHDLTVLKAT